MACLQLRSVSTSCFMAVFQQPVRIGIGVHFGEVIIGEIGHPQKHQITAIGDNVNLASRMETATKKVQANILVSDDVRAKLGDQFEFRRTFTARLKGKTGSYRLHELKCG